MSEQIEPQTGRFHVPQGLGLPEGTKSSARPSAGLQALPSARLGAALGKQPILPTPTAPHTWSWGHLGQVG